MTSDGQSFSLVLTKLRIRYKGDHKCRRAANTGLTLLPLNLTVLHITRTFLSISTSWGCHQYGCKLFLVNLLHVMHGLMSTYNYLISSCAYPGWASHKINMDVQVLNRSVNPAFLCCCLVAGVLALLCCLVYFGTNPGGTERHKGFRDSERARKHSNSGEG